MKEVLLIILAFIYLLLITASHAQSTRIFTISGRVLDSLTGNPIESGNVTAIVKENGNTNSSRITSGTYTINLTSNITDKKITIGIVTNSTDGKMGYSFLIVNLGEQATQDQKCSNKRWRFNGTAINSTTGSFISSGRISISAKETGESNSTTFSNGIWDIFFTPCLISGEIYTFQIKITDTNKVGELTLKQVAK